MGHRAAVRAMSDHCLAAALSCAVPGRALVRAGDLLCALPAAAARTPGGGRQLSRSRWAWRPGCWDRPSMPSSSQRWPLVSRTGAPSTAATSPSSTTSPSSIACYRQTRFCWRRIVARRPSTRRGRWCSTWPTCRPGREVYVFSGDAAEGIRLSGAYAQARRSMPTRVPGGPSSGDFWAAPETGDLHVVRLVRRRVGSGSPVDEGRVVEVDRRHWSFSLQ